MTQAFLLGRALLRFGEGNDAETIVGELSAAAFDADGRLWLASDELSGGRVTLSCLVDDGRGAFADHQQFAVGDYVDLLEEEGDKVEADIEGLDVADHYLWFIGSHSSKRAKPKGKNWKKDLDRLARVEVEANRYLLGRIPLISGEPARSGQHPEHPQQTLTAARLASGQGGNALIEALQDDRHLGPFLRTMHGEEAMEVLPLASKENGFDIEGLAAFDDRLFLGLRGPVLRGWALLLEIKPIEQGQDRLGLAAIEGKRLYRKHFVNLDGLGIRELARDGDDLLILAGPTMTLDGALRLFRLCKPNKLEDDSITEAGDALETLFDLPTVSGGDNAEGLAITTWLGERGLLVVYDGPKEARRPAPGTVFADVFRLQTST